MTELNNFFGHMMVKTFENQTVVKTHCCDHSEGDFSVLFEFSEFFHTHDTLLLSFCELASCAWLN